MAVCEYVSQKAYVSQDDRGWLRNGGQHSSTVAVGTNPTDGTNVN